MSSIVSSFEICQDDDTNGDAFLLVVKGNLRHRIDLLGVEAHDAVLNDTQRRLREIVRAQPAGVAHVTDGERPPCPERPDWAGGAFIFLHPHETEAARRVIEQKQKEGNGLQSKHILVSNDLYHMVKELLDAKPQGSGREAFLRRRAGVVERKGPISFRPEKPGSAASGRRGHQECHDELGTDAGRDRLKEAFCRPLCLSYDVMEQRDIDLELLEFLTAPVSVQEMDPAYREEKWAEAWELVGEENQWWMHSQKDEQTGREWPYCNLCREWASPSHLTSASCRSRVEQQTALHGVHKGPLVEEILKAAAMENVTGRAAQNAEAYRVGAPSEGGDPSQLAAQQPGQLRQPSSDVGGRGGKASNRGRGRVGGALPAAPS